MWARPVTVRDAVEMWLSRCFDAINQDIIARLMKYEPDKWREVTVPVAGDSVFVFKTGTYGDVIECDKQSGDYRIRLVNDSKMYARAKDFRGVYFDKLPAWRTMWSFSDDFDDRWFRKQGGLEIMSELGFRVYEHEDFGYFFGIDGAGYDFYEAHWIPLYRARGLLWHKPEEG